MSNPVDILSAVRRSDQALCEQVARWEALDIGVAYCSTNFPILAVANQLRDAWLAEVDGPSAYERAETYYRERHLTCLAWTPASGQAIEPLEGLLTPKGWRRVDRLAMSLTDWSILESESEATIRVLPARAMPKAHRQTYADAGASDEETAAAIERLNDSNYDAFVASIDGRPAGRIGYLEVGDIARLSELWVEPSLHGRGVGPALLQHALQLARRLLPRAIVTAVEVTNTKGRDFLVRCGFESGGTLTHFARPSP